MENIFFIVIIILVGTRHFISISISVPATGKIKSTGCRRLVQLKPVKLLLTSFT